MNEYVITVGCCEICRNESDLSLIEYSCPLPQLQFRFPDVNIDSLRLL